MNIWTNGCFDILHIGHIELFKFAKSLGDQLIVGIDSDQRIKSLKGESRPINNQHDRKGFLESIKYIDKVVIFDTEDALRGCIQNLQIQAIVVGSDYADKPIIGSEYAKVKIFPRIPNISTTNILGSITSG